jgi:serine/threonine protein kinase
MDDNLTNFAPAKDETEIRLGAGESSSASTDTQTGQIIARAYQLGRCLGSGGMGVVYEARQLVLNKAVALKLLNQTTAGTPEVVERFRREAIAISSLDHPNIVRLHTFDVDEKDQAYLVMDLVEGKSLAEIIKERGRLEPRDALQVTGQVLAALDHAHSHHIIHRDIKPGNIMVIEKPDGALSVKVVDFGLAKVVGANDGMSQNFTLTKTGEMLGSPHYMSPEQCTGDALDERSDIYSTGCVLYEMLTGQPPYSGDNFLKILHQHATSEPKALSDLNSAPQILACLNKILQLAMAKSVTARYPNAETMSKDVRSLLQDDWTKSAAPLQEAESIEAKNSENDLRKTLSLNRMDTFFLLASLAFLFVGQLSAISVKPSPIVAPPPVQEAPKPSAVHEAYWNPDRFSLHHLCVTDPTTHKPRYFDEDPERIIGTHNLLSTGDKPLPYTQDDSTMDGGIPTLFLTDASLKEWIKSLANLEGRKFVLPAPDAIVDAAYKFQDMGDMGRAISYYQQLLQYAKLSDKQETAVTARLGDCYMYYNRFDAAAGKYLDVCNRLKNAKNSSDVYLLAETQLKLAYCDRLGVDLPHLDYALEAYRTLKTHNQLNTKNIAVNVLLGDINLMRGLAAEALRNYDEAFPGSDTKTMAADQSAKDSYGLWLGLLELRRTKAYLALQQPDQAITALNRALAVLNAPKGTQLRIDKKKQAAALKPRLYFSLGLAYQKKSKLQSNDKDSLNKAVLNFEKAIQAADKANPKADHNTFFEMCSNKIYKLDPDYIITVPNLKNQTTDGSWKNLEPYRAILPPSFLQQR